MPQAKLASEQQEAHLEPKASLLAVQQARVASLLAQTAQLAWVAQAVALTEPLASPQLEQEALLASGAVLALPPQEQVVLAWALVVAKLADHRPDSRALASV